MNRVCNNFLGLKGVDDPHGDITDEQESNNLSAWLAAVMFGEVYTAACDISNKKKLKDNLEGQMFNINCYATMRAVKMTTIMLWPCVHYKYVLPNIIVI